VVEAELGGLHFGDPAAQAGSALAFAGGWVDQCYLVDLGELAQDPFGAGVDPVLVCFAFDQVDDGERECADEGVCSEFLVGPVEGG
jgi:hypothetical protein